MADLTRKLPLELLAEILGHASVADILRFKLVNRAFHDAALFSPLIQHKIDLYSTGLEYNAAAGVSLADSRKDLLQYRSSLDPPRLSEGWAVEDIGTTEGFHWTAGGVHAILFGDSVRLFTLGSLSRGVPFKEWRIPLPVGRVDTYCFHPGADVIAFVSLDRYTPPQFGVCFRTLSGGKHHPAAQCSTIHHLLPASRLLGIRSVSISGSRFVVLTGMEKALSRTVRVTYLTIWDWKNGRVLLELSGRPYETVEFLDDYRLLATLQLAADPMPSLVVIDTSEDVGGIPMQTFLHLSPCPGSFRRVFQILERAAHNPPPESLATFHHDPTQRIIALRYSSNHLILQVKTLLKLAESHGGSEIGWDEWKNHVVVLPFGFEFVDAGVSGCRFFCVYEEEHTQGATIMVYDFSKRKLGKYLREYVDRGLDTDRGSSKRGDWRRMGHPLPNGVGVKIPWPDSDNQHIVHDCYVFTRQRWEEDDTGEHFSLHIWALS